ncbi:DUF4349 domain-containing protein [Paenibacillus cremeus]|uniref:DUF4349 domain-containing protein n=1 Tax=Paenibacillus cremeus TaxID=2163881 RepID=A0A559KBV1_9BACL|nr:DUF4349 domain-containing protein [Paenibacillus cremeus]TVY09606.1 DUF4349 domain-containing protein [Paenibacillus cremeus]
MEEKERRVWPRHARGLAGAVALLLLLSGCSALSSKADMAVSTGTAGHAESKAVAPQGAADSAGGPAAVADMAKMANATASNTVSAPAGAQGSFTGQALPDNSDAYTRKIIYTAHLVMQVEKYQDVAQQVQETVKQAGAYILQFNENTMTNEKSGTFTIKVPANGFQSLLSQLEKLNPTMQKSLQGQDVTEEYVDLTARLKAKQVVESRLTAFMEKATKAEELVSFSNELGKVQEEIERIKGRMRYLEQNVAYSTIELRVTQKIGSAEIIQSRDRGPLITRSAAALNGSVVVLSVALQWLVVILAGALPVLILLALIGIPLWMVRKRRLAKLVSVRSTLLEHNQAQANTQTETKDPNE